DHGRVHTAFRRCYRAVRASAGPSSRSDCQLTPKLRTISWRACTCSQRNADLQPQVFRLRAKGPGGSWKTRSRTPKAAAVRRRLDAHGAVAENSASRAPPPDYPTWTREFRQLSNSTLRPSVVVTVASHFSRMS